MHNDVNFGRNREDLTPFRLQKPHIPASTSQPRVDQMTLRDTLPAKCFRGSPACTICVQRNRDLAPKMRMVVTLNGRTRLPRARRRHATAENAEEL